MLQLTRILVPVDFSKESNLALDWAIRIAMGEPNATIVLAHVMAPVMSPVGPEAFAFSVYVKKGKKTQENALMNIQRRLPPTLSSSVIVTEGPAASEIVRLCKDQAIDVVVMTTHGRRGLSHLLHGSVTEEIVRLAPCPVLVLHLNPKEIAASHSST